jgi:DNA-directed RNA polymerase subunit L
VWRAGGKQASYIIRHPYLSEPKFIVRAKDPKKMLDMAAQMIIDDTRELENAVKKKLK